MLPGCGVRKDEKHERGCDIKTKNKKIRIKEKKPLFWFGCYGTWSPAKEDCANCQQLKWCKDAIDKFKPEQESRYGVMDKMEHICANADGFQFFDDTDSSQCFTMSEMINVLSYVFRLSLREFYYIQCKLVNPKMTIREIGHPLKSSRQNIDFQFRTLLRRKPELAILLRMRRRMGVKADEISKTVKKGDLLKMEVGNERG